MDLVSDIDPKKQKKDVQAKKDSLFEDKIEHYLRHINENFDHLKLRILQRVNPFDQFHEMTKTNRY